ncbi:hypothetical protein ACFV1C_16065 [Streptomyces sp. NPDC059605]|uniref:hypothetical protein n=1 Tax=Streptomyces sp. NPDC059605 TaxID=3346882 RepID=UPI0036A02A0E
MDCSLACSTVAVHKADFVDGGVRAGEPVVRRPLCARARVAESGPESSATAERASGRITVAAPPLGAVLRPR